MVVRWGQGLRSRPYIIMPLLAPHTTIAGRHSSYCSTHVAKGNQTGWVNNTSRQSIVKCRSHITVVSLHTSRSTTIWEHGRVARSSIARRELWHITIDKLRRSCNLNTEQTYLKTIHCRLDSTHADAGERLGERTTGSLQAAVWVRRATTIELVGERSSKMYHSKSREVASRTRRSSPLEMIGPGSALDERIRGIVATCGDFELIAPVLYNALW